MNLKTIFEVWGSGGCITLVLSKMTSLTHICSKVKTVTEKKILSNKVIKIMVFLFSFSIKVYMLLTYERYLSTESILITLFLGEATLW